MADDIRVPKVGEIWKDKISSFYYLALSIEDNTIEFDSYDSISRRLEIHSKCFLSDWLDLLQFHRDTNSMKVGDEIIFRRTPENDRTVTIKGFDDERRRLHVEDKETGHHLLISRLLAFEKPNPLSFSDFFESISYGDTIEADEYAMCVLQKIGDDVMVCRRGPLVPMFMTRDEFEQMWNEEKGKLWVKKQTSLDVLEAYKDKRGI